MNRMDASSAAVDQEVPPPHVPMHHDPESARRDVAAWEAMHQSAKQDERRLHARMYTTGRLLLGCCFVAAAAFKTIHFSAATIGLDARGYSDASILLFIAVATEFVGGSMLVLRSLRQAVRAT